MIQGYIWGKTADAFAAGSTARFDLSGYGMYDYFCLGAGLSIILLVVIVALTRNSSTLQSAAHGESSVTNV